MNRHSGKTEGVNVRVQSQVPRDAGLARTALVLVGFMGAGKTSVGRALAHRLNWTFEDLDERIEQREQRSVSEIFRDSGEPEFRRAEHAALRDVLREIQSGAVKIVALGGGAFVQDRNSALLGASGVPTIFLDAPVEELWQRCCTQAREAGTERPLLRSIDQFRQLYEARRPGYLRAVLAVQTGHRTVNQIAAEIAELLSLKAVDVRAQEGEVE